jgi:hypothetical protein
MVCGPGQSSSAGSGQGRDIAFVALPMSAKFTQSDADRIAKAAAKYGVAMRAEIFAADGSKAVLYAGMPNELNGDSVTCANEIDQWIAKHENEAKGH